MGGVKGTRYLLPILYCNIRTQKNAYLQTILKAHVKFQKDRTKTVGGVKGIRCLLKIPDVNPTYRKDAKKFMEKHLSSVFSVATSKYFV